MAAAEWIDIQELAVREQMTVGTLRHMAGTREISYRRRGPGRRAKLEFNAAVVHAELEARRATPSRTAVARPDANPTLFTLLTEVRELKEIVGTLTARLSPTSHHASQ